MAKESSPKANNTQIPARKRKKRIHFDITAALIAILIMVVLAFLVFIAVFFYTENADVKKLSYDLMSSLVTAVTVGLFTSISTNIIIKGFARVNRNNKMLSKFGVEYIGGGKSNRIDDKNLFGDKLLNRYPTEIKILFISGNGFFAKYQKHIFDCIKNSDCTVKILLVSTAQSNEDYLDRMEKICPQEKHYSIQVNSETIPTLQQIVDQLDDSKKKQLKLRFYKDEYRYNFRIAKYCYEDNTVGKCWLNVQPFNKDAIDLSVRLDGKWDDHSSEEENVFLNLDSGFDTLWDTYESTEYKFN